MLATEYKPAKSGENELDVTDEPEYDDDADNDRSSEGSTKVSNICIFCSCLSPCYPNMLR